MCKKCEQYVDGGELLRKGEASTVITPKWCLLCFFISGLLTSALWLLLLGVLLLLVE